jgi:putative phosphoribosyl transferase
MLKKSQVNIPIGKNILLHGNLSIPGGARSLVIFSHGSARSRFSTRNRLISNKLNKGKTATLLIDLLTEEEDDFHENHFDIDLLSDRLAEITTYASLQPELKNLPIGFWGASTGSASALQASAKLGNMVQAVVSRSGRPDLANNLNQVKVPALLIVGSLDKEFIRMNELAGSILNCERKIEIVKGASNLFAEPGKLNEVCTLATGWFNKYLFRASNLFTTKSIGN